MFAWTGLLGMGLLNHHLLKTICMYVHIYIFISLNCFCAFVKNPLAVVDSICLTISGFCSSPWIFMSVSQPISHSLDYWCTALRYELKSGSGSPLGSHTSNTLWAFHSCSFPLKFWTHFDDIYKISW